MIDHTGVIVSDIAKSKAFYSAALGAAGISLLKEFPASVTGSADVAGYGAKEVTTEGVSPEFWLRQGKPGNVPAHVAFRVDRRALVDASIAPHWPPAGATTAAGAAAALSSRLLWRVRPRSGWQ